jgi:hypothetical protein
MTISGGGFTLNANQQLTLTSALTNNGTFTMKDGATFVQGTSVTSITGAGTYNVEKALTGNTSSWSNTSGRFWYMGVPMKNVARSNYGTPGVTTKQPTLVLCRVDEVLHRIDGMEVQHLSAGTGYVHRRSTNGTLTLLQPVLMDCIVIQTLQLEWLNKNNWTFSGVSFDLQSIHGICRLACGVPRQTLNPRTTFVQITQRVPTSVP